jgi:predicted KAP-like P-loop ATPase
MAAHQTSATTTPDVGALAQYHTDVPIHTSDEDEFDRAPFARRIAQTIVGRRDPSSLVLGIYGPWGEGKTSVLNLIRTTLGDIWSAARTKTGDAF